jgi:hypothetical protein
MAIRSSGLACSHLQSDIILISFISVSRSLYASFPWRDHLDRCLKIAWVFLLDPCNPFLRACYTLCYFPSPSTHDDHLPASLSHIQRASAYRWSHYLEERGIGFSHILFADCSGDFAFPIQDLEEAVFCVRAYIQAFLDY